MKCGYSRSLVVLLGALALLIASGQAAFADTRANFAGKFKGDKLSAELVAAGDGTYTGTISLASGQFPLKAHVENGVLQGTFSSGASDFPFSAQLSGGTLSLTSGQSTYSLARAAVNPLDGPSPNFTPTQAVSPDAPATPTVPATPDASATPSPEAQDLFKQGQAAEDKQDFAGAADLYRKSAQQGYAPAMDNLGFLYQNGTGVEQDNAAAMTWYRKAADAGNTSAMGNIGWLYANGLGVKADYTEALAWYTKAADKGHGSSMNKIGLLYLNGTGVDKDEAKAVEWFRKAADAGDDDGMYDLGYAYENGTGVTKDLAQAELYYRKSADAGLGMGMNKVGLCYLDGNGVDKDPVAAVGWFRKAADAGDVNGFFDMGYCCENGVGITKDHDAAVGWYRKSAAAGSDDAKKWLADNAAPQAAAAPAGNSGDVTGKWAVAGDVGKDKFTITFGKDGTTTVETADGSSAGGMGWKFANSAITFDGSNSMNGLTVGGTWKVQWTGADSFKATDDNGKVYTMTRQAK